MAKKDVTLDALKHELERAFKDLKDSERRIKKYTDKWVESQKNRLNIEESLEKLGYSYNVKKLYRGSWSGDFLCDIQLVKLKK